MNKKIPVFALSIGALLLAYIIDEYGGASIGRMRIYIYAVLGFLLGAVFLLISSIEKKRTHLEESEESSRKLLETASDFVFALDLEGNITYFSEKAEKLTGYRKEEILGKSMAVLLSSDALQNFLEKMQSSSEIASFQFEINTIYGKKLVELNLGFIKKAGEISGILGIGEDITEKIKLEAELKKKAEEVEKWRARVIERELKILELKKQLGETPPEV